MARIPGKIRKLIMGPMSSGKTEELIQSVRRVEKHSKERWIAFKPSKDTRSRHGMIESKTDGDQKGDSIPAIEIPAEGEGPWEIFEYLRIEEARSGIVSLVVVDEINFFPADSSFYDVVLRLMELGYDLALSGLAYDYRDRPFGSTLLFAGWAGSNCIFLTAHCDECKNEGANHSQRIYSDGTIADFNEKQEKVDGTECGYRPLCDICFRVPGRPVPKY
ncbi:MAG: hypothetical protein KGJ13_06205 [Patescibacteria group bacterium]|nr:hypothetical protein [Patescibacteria group bacterium]